ncbi:RWD-domain-containing protein [Irpex rosettiformis]|uniref:RWD-domain-containing protein n=1 Tax=Irpex rosettiformis TaxID=378272 RepID=A0ACB8TUN6_9APHY|nr:RWD-domain-containing protein [Irpex rosettiformis]
METEDVQRCSELRNEEWEVIQSIYPDYISNSAVERVIKLEIPVELSQPTRILVVPEDAPGGPSNAANQAQNINEPLSLGSLPPLLLEIILPPLYPLHLPPTILSVHATHSWFDSKTAQLSQRLVGLWQAGEGSLYTWIEWIRSADFLDDIGLIVIDGEKCIRIPHPAPQLLSPLLIASDAETQRLRFSETSYSCEICLTSIKGARCLRLACSHVFCRSCLEDFWKLCIKEGDVAHVGCPDPACVKEAREASEEEVRRVVTEEEVQRWRWLRQKRLFEKDPTMVHCPVPFCQSPVSRPPNVDEDSPWERLRTCSECGYSFCAYCRRAWHGTINECTMSSTETFVMEYVQLPEGSAGRELLERRYGRKNLRRLVAEYEENQANKKYMDESTMACPGCRVKVEKSVGCNHMTCAKCGQHFCYRCGVKLRRLNPYLHFSTPGLPCFSKLFDFENTEQEWQPIEGFDML